MKKNMIYLAAFAIMMTAFVSCKKDGTTTTTAAATSTFTVRGNSFTTPATSGYTSFQTLNGFGTLAVYGLSDSKAKSIAYFFFYNTAKPAAGSYSVVAGNPTNTSQVGLSVLDSVSIAKQGFFAATGTDNVKATVSVNAGGKLSIALPVTQVSGSNLDNTNPNNTVTTTVSTTISGTFNEQ